MNKSESIKNIAIALNKLQSEISSVPKTSDNPFFKSKYADLASIMSALQPHLKETGLSITGLLEPSEDKTKLSMTFLLMHTTGEFIEFNAQMPIDKQTPQAMGSAITYLRRYILGSVFGIVTDEDDDGNKSSGVYEKRDIETPQSILIKFVNDKKIDPKLVKMTIEKEFGPLKSGDLNIQQVQKVIEIFSN